MAAVATGRQNRHQVVVIGSGFGGLFATKALRKADVQVTLISRTSHHLFQPLLYQVATGILSEGEIAPATRDILRRQRNVQVLLGDVVDIDLERRVVVSQSLAGGRETEYDSLVVAAGAGQSYFGHEEFAAHAPGLKSIDDALELRGRIFGSYELAELAEDPAEVARLLTFVVVGAGATGVEMAGQIAELAHRALPGDFRAIDPTATRIVLLDAADAVLAPYGPKLSQKARLRLKKIGVEVHLETEVTGVDETGVDVRHRDGRTERIRSACVVWAAGVAASPLGRRLAEQSGAEVDRAGRVQALADCTLPSHPEVHVVGDLLGNGLPGVAQVAIQSARHAADQIRRRVQGRETGQPFQYHDKGSMATVSRFSAVAMVGPLRLSGIVAWLLWLAIHLFYLIGFKNRLTTLLHWTVSFIGSDRSERTVTEQQVLARVALAQARTTEVAPPAPTAVQ